MKTAELIEYILKNIKQAGYVKGPVYTHEIYEIPGIDYYRNLVRIHDKHDEVLSRLKKALADSAEPEPDDLVYAFHHLDHPETECHHTFQGAWQRPTSEQVLSQAKERIAKIDKWEEVKEELFKRIMNPNNLEIRAVEWERCKYYPQHMSSKTVYETNGNWPNSHGMYLSAAGWMTEEMRKVNSFHEPAFTLGDGAAITATGLYYPMPTNRPF